MRILVTGGCSGIGKEIVSYLLAQNHEVIVLDKNVQNMPCKVIESDITKDKLEDLDIDVLVNNAGIIRINEFKEQKENDWKDMIQTNLIGSMICSKFYSKSLIKNKGCIINIISTDAFAKNDKTELGVDLTVAYAASKAGLIGFTKALAVEFGKLGVRVNGIAPGLTKTSMTKELFEDKFTKEYLEKQLPLKRFVDKKDIAKTVSFLIENKSITGEIITVDCGFMVK
jgi:3-oxoacyl-[acyl-carrier protein] reductase